MKLSKIRNDAIDVCTNILEIEVPPELEKTVCSGIEFLDAAMGGPGFTPSASILYTGTPGAGKTTLMLQAAEAITMSGNLCLFNTAEESLYQVRKTSRRLGVKSGFFVGQDYKVDKILAHAKLIQSLDPSKQLFLIVDSLQTLDDGFYPNGYTNSKTQVRATEMLCDFAKETFAIVVIIGHVTKGDVFAGKQEIKHDVDCHMHIGLDDDKKSETFGMRLLNVTKNRWGCSGREYVLQMRENGLEEVGSYSMVA